MWVDYWELSNRLADAQQEEIDGFTERWKGSYVEDRLRNDWLLELGRRADWAHFAQEYPRFRMNDDRDVACCALLVEHLAGTDVRAAARAAWAAQRDADEGCAAMASTLYEAGRFTASDVWRKARLAIEGGRPRAARQAVELIGPSAAKAFDEMVSIAVSDTGIGMAADLIPRVFDLFVQGDRGLDRREGGLGVGLTVARRLAELLGGTLTATSAGPGLGRRGPIGSPVSASISRGTLSSCNPFGISPPLDSYRAAARAQAPLTIGARRSARRLCACAAIPRSRP